MGRQSRQFDTPQGFYGFSAVTDSMVLDDRFVADAVRPSAKESIRIPRVFLGIRNGFLLSAALWALILGGIFALT